MLLRLTNMKVLLVLICIYVATIYCQLNDRPIIGILAQKQYGKDARYGPTYIAASYVKFLEAAGARVVPIRINQTEAYYKELFKSVNGILFPGGSAKLTSSGYGVAGKILYNLAITANDHGDYFPLWGTCLGFELFNYLAVNKNWMEFCSVQDVVLPLSMVKGYKTSRMFKNMPTEVERILTSQPVTINYHYWCLTEKNYSKSGLDKYYRILTTSSYKNEVFISTIEAYKYPFYAVTWHPEKNQYEFILRRNHYNIPHSAGAIRISQYFANYFVNETRKNKHKFPSDIDEKKALIYNYQPVYTGLGGSDFEQKYFF